MSESKSLFGDYRAYLGKDTKNGAYLGKDTRI